MTLAVGDARGGLALFDARAGTRIVALESATSIVPPTSPPQDNSDLFDPDEPEDRWPDMPFLVAQESTSDALPNAGKTDHATNIDWSSDGTRILTATDDGTVKLWDAIHRTLSRDVRVASGRRRATAAFCGDAIVLGDETGPARRVPSGGLDDAAHEERLAFAAATLVRSRDGALAAVDWEGKATVDSSLRCAGDRAASEIATLPLPRATGDSREEDRQGRINRIAWSADGTLIAATVMDPIDTLKIWDTRSGEQVRTVTRDAFTFDWDVAFAPGGKDVAVTTKSSTVLVHDWTTSRWTTRLGGTGTADGLGLAFDPDGKWLASSATAGGIISGGVDLWSLAAASSASLSPARLPSCRTNVLVWGRVLVVRCLDHPVVEIWRPSARAPLRRITTKGAIGWSSDGGLVVTCEAVKRPVKDPRSKPPRARSVLACRIQETTTGKERPTVELESDLDRGTELALNAQGDRLAAVSKDGGMRLWDLGTRASISMRDSDGRVILMRWSPDGRQSTAC